jgi:hypothetical protein
MENTVKIGPFKFAKTWASHRSRFRLLPATVNELGYIPVLTCENKRNICKLPDELNGLHVGVLNTSSTNVFDILAQKLVCHVFDPNFSPDEAGKYLEPKQHTRRMAIVFGNEPHATDVITKEKLTLDGFFERFPDLHDIDHPDYLRKFNREKKLFGFGFRFKNRDLAFEGLTHKKSGTHIEVLNAKFKKALDDLRPLMKTKDLSAATLVFDLKGSFIYSLWAITSGKEMMRRRIDVFPFVWDDLISKPLPADAI